MADTNQTTKPKSKRGGPRPGSGRKPKQSPRMVRESFYEVINTKDEIAELHKMWALFKQVAVEKAQNSGNTEDLQWIFSRIMPVPKEQDIKVDQDVTSNGQTVGMTISFGTKELNEWKDEK